jgi:hypothetical protein
MGISCFFEKNYFIIVRSRDFDGRVWAYILKRVVVRFFWNFYTIIWHLYKFSFGDWKIFPTAGVFLRAKRKIEADFLYFFDVINLNEIFYVMKVIGKIHLGVFVIGRIINFHFRPIFEFSDSRFWRY